MIRDVVIAGAGPTGLMLASELGCLGIRAIVLERLQRPTGLSKALGIQARTMELLDHRGLLERFARGRQSPPFSNFAVFQLDPHAIDFGHPYGLVIPQAEIEGLLAGRAVEVGAELRRGHELTGLRQEDDAVLATVVGPDGSYEERCRFLVGCDGAHSAVRKLAGVPFPGLVPTVVARFGEVVLGADAWPMLHEAVPELRERDFGVARTATGNFAIVPVEAGRVRIAAIEWPAGDTSRDVPMTLDELQDALRRVIGTTLPMSDPGWMSRAFDNSRQAERYRDRRVLLAGDAAHVHFAYGGMGLQTGVQDAGNLGWKLAAELRGWAPPGTLDSYEAERRPVGQRVLMATRAATELSRPGEHVTALRQVFQELISDAPALRRILEMVTSVDVHYDMGEPPEARHALTGRWVPDLAITLPAGPARVAELMRRARGVLLDLTPDAPFAREGAGWVDRVDAVAASVPEGTAPATALLVRPDGYVAWAAAQRQDRTDATRALRAALRRWFGDPAEHRHAGGR